MIHFVVNGETISQTTIDENEIYDRNPREGDTMHDDEGDWYFEDGQWWSE